LKESKEDIPVEAKSETIKKDLVDHQAKANEIIKDIRED
jgi:hypothetical protein